MADSGVERSCCERRWALKSCIRDRKAQVNDPVKQTDIEIERLGRIIGAVVGEGLDWRRRGKRGKPVVTSWREMP